MFAFGYHHFPHLTVFFVAIILDFNYFLYISDVELDPNRVWCPSAGCETICTFQPASNPDIGVSVLCLKVRKYLYFLSHTFLV